MLMPRSNIHAMELSNNHVVIGDLNTCLHYSPKWLTLFFGDLIFSLGLCLLLRYSIGCKASHWPNFMYQGEWFTLYSACALCSQHLFIPFVFGGCFCCYILFLLYHCGRYAFQKEFFPFTSFLIHWLVLFIYYKLWFTIYSTCGASFSWHLFELPQLW